MQIDPKNPKYTDAFSRLLQIMNELREQCPWDKKQSIESIRHLTIEETFELSDAILEGDLQEVRNELGDLMLHIVFYARMAAEKDAFDMADVLNGICEKLIRRHPHIYADTKVNDEEDVKRNWEAIKLTESDKPKSVLAGVPKSLPALIKAQRIQEKARGVGFDWENKEQVWEKVQEEMQEFEQALAQKNAQEMEAELGDWLFSIINYARFLNINPETALEKTNLKFINRFKYIEQKAQETGKALSELNLAQMDIFWNEAKEFYK